MDLTGELESHGSCGGSHPGIWTFSVFDMRFDVSVDVGLHDYRPRFQNIVKQCLLFDPVFCPT